MNRVLVTGAAGFIGGHLCRHLKRRAPFPLVRGIDYVAPRYGKLAVDEAFWDCDLRYIGNAIDAMAGCDEVYHCAADMGGMGYISGNHFNIFTNNALININVAKAAEAAGVKRILFTSSACVYPEDLQMDDEAGLLREDDAWHGKADTAYGIEKLMGEEVFTTLAQKTGMEVRLARFHNIFGPNGAWRGGKEKAPAALLRKAAKAATSSGQIEVWGDGEALRSFCYISDCIQMLLILMHSPSFAPDELTCSPVNIGTDRAVTINELARIAGRCAGIEDIKLVHAPGPQGVRGRNADLTRMRRVLNGYAPKISLEAGMARTYQWIEREMYG